MKRWIPVTAVVLAGAALAWTNGPLPLSDLLPEQAERRESARPEPGRTQERDPSPPPSTPAPAEADPEEAVAAALAPLEGHAGRMSLAVEDVASGTYAVHGADTGTYDTASAVKVDILATLLLQAQDRGTGLTSAQQALASDMIRDSDNDATDALWEAIGGSQGLDAANETFGLTGTTAGTYGRWGLTQTSATDQILLLEAVLGENSPLDDGSRRYLRSLMSDITPGQDWGITAASDPGAAKVVKNGWLPRSQTDLWDVNSIGRVEYGGRTLLVCVLTDEQPSKEAGIALVEDAATRAVHALVHAVDDDTAG